MTRLMNLALIVLFAVVVTGCAGIPTQELSQYRTAFAAAQQASVDILVDFAAAKAAATPAGPKPAVVAFSSDLGNLVTKQPETVEVCQWPYGLSISLTTKS